MEGYHKFAKEACNPGLNAYNKVKKSSKIGQDQKALNLLLRNFWLLLPKFNFWKGDWELGSTSTQLLDFLHISCHKSFSNSWGNSYIMLFILDIKLTNDELTLY